MDVDRPPSFMSVAPRTGSQLSHQLMDTSFSSINQQAPSIGSMLGSRENSQPSGGSSCSSYNWPPSHGDVAPRDSRADSQLTGGDECEYSSGGINGFSSPRADVFPAGLRVLVVDGDPISLKILEKMLKKCSYEVMSVDGETSRVLRGIQHGACDYLLKPIRMTELRNIWQHVYRKKVHEGLSYVSSGDSATGHLFASAPIPAHFLHQNSDQFMPDVPVAALQQQQQQMDGNHGQLQPMYGQFGCPRNVQFEHPLLNRQNQQVMGGVIRYSMPLSCEDEFESANGRKVLTLFPIGDD